MEAFRRWIQPRLVPSVYIPVGAILLVLVLAMIPLGCGMENRAIVPRGTPVVRVCILEKKTRVELAFSQPPTIRVGNGAATRLNASGGSGMPITLINSAWQVGDIPAGSGELSIEPAGEGSVSIDGRAYRGSFRLVARSNGKFDVINDVDIDGYLMGVIAKEMLAGWHEEAYRTQAIVARTYALYVARTGTASASYDLFADTRSQVYGGIAAESAKSRGAVQATRGIVVAYGSPGQERIFKAYFSSCCGGVTQSAADAFGDAAAEPLSEQNIGPVCAASPKFSWAAVVISKPELTRRIRVWGNYNNAPERSIGDVARIDVLSTNPFGRPASFTITDVRGYRYRLCSEDMRIAINTDASDGPRIWSSFCRPINEAGHIRFADGHGFGHGVGLCQWCAQEQAKAGVSHEQIVLRAYPKSVLVRAY